MQLVWFRQDLRQFDHAALHHAMAQGATVALVVLSPAQWQQHQDAPIKLDFYLRQLQQLKNNLNALNVPLLILNVADWHALAAPFLRLCQDLNISHVHCNVEVGSNEHRRDQAIQDLLKPQGIAWQSYQDRTLFPLGSIRNQSGQPYQVFSAFKKYCYQQLSISLATCYPIPAPQSVLAIDLQHYNTQVPHWSDLSDIRVAAEHSALWPVGEDYALDVLDEFIADRLIQYDTARDFPHRQGTSQLSAYLNIGIISIRSCLQALFRQQHGYFDVQHAGQQTWLDELLWREFYQHLMFDFPKLSQHKAFKPATEHIQWRTDHHDLQAWQQGLTGVPIVDAGIRQMLHTGWMHNRVRMIVAMFFSKNLLLDWRLGEAWFMQHLIDGDLAANNGGWQWCASTGTDSVPYFRIFNPITQSQKFDPNGDYLRRWLPELRDLDHKTIHDPYGKTPHRNLNYPRPIVDLKASRQRALDAFKQV